MRGRRPKPTWLRQLAGNPGKRPLNEHEPDAPDGTPEPPEWLDGEALMEWQRVTATLADMGLLSTADRAALAAYCVCYGRWAEAEQQVRLHGTIVKSPNKGFPMVSPFLVIADRAMEAMRRFLTEFGLTPASRSRVAAREPESETSVEAFAAERKVW